VRLFVALDIPEPVRAALIECSTKLSKTCRVGRWVRLEGAHITLKFIGEVPDDRVDSIRAALGEIRGFSPIEMRFAGLGFFPSTNRPRILWAGIETGPELAALAKSVEDRLAELEIEREKRDFRPHITLARFESPNGLDPLRDAISKLGVSNFGHATIREFCLYRSVLKRSGAEYTRVSTYSFSGESSSQPLP
jgi:2'-5' RNA ligase